MKPTVIASNASASAAAGSGAPPTSSNGVNIPISHEFSGHHAPYYADASATAYGSPHQHPQHPQHPHHHQQQQQPQPQPGYHQQQQHPQHHAPQPNQTHFQQDFGFDPNMDIDMDMFSRSRLGRMHDPFAGFGGTRKRSSVHDPFSHHTDDFSHYFDDDADFDFPQFGSLGRRRTGADPMSSEHDFFNRLPSEFRQYIPDGFGHRRAGSGHNMPAHQPPNTPPTAPPPGQYYQNYGPAGGAPPPANGGGAAGGYQQSPSKRLCDAAIQTDGPEGRSEVDNARPMLPTDNLNQHGLRNTVDMGVKAAAETDKYGSRSQSAPPPAAQQPQQPQQQQQQNGRRVTPPSHGGQHQFGTQTSQPSYSPQPQAQPQPQFHKTYYAPQQQAHPQQKQQTPPPQTPGGSYIRTIPIFVEGRSEPIINNRDIPNQTASGPSTPSSASASASATASAWGPPPSQQQHQQHHQQQQQHPHRPTPLNTQQQHSVNQQQPQGSEESASAGLPPQTPHTLDSINKIQDIQRDVLALMAKVEKFGGTRKDKEYVYLDEMLTRNLLKLDTIDTNGKESIRLARKEAIKCIQASINVLEAKAEQNSKTAANVDSGVESEAAITPTPTEEQAPQKSGSKGDASNGDKQATAGNEATAVEITNSQEPIPLPPPENMEIENETAVTKTTETAATEAAAECLTEASTAATAAETK